VSRYFRFQADAAEAMKLIDEQKDFSARALGYAHDGKKTKRTDPKEHCGNCKQYKKTGVVDGAEVGKCSLPCQGAGEVHRMVPLVRQRSGALRQGVNPLRRHEVF
jgi:hypothetical protein